MESVPLMRAGGSEPPAQNDDVLIRLLADFADAGRFGKRTLEVTASHVRILESGGAESLRVPIDVIKSARNEPLVGGGRLELQLKSGEILPVVSYSLTVAAKFSEAARGIEQLSKGEPLLINLKEERLRCAKCNRLLPEKDGVCPACVQRSKTLMRILRFMKPYRKQAWILAIGATLSTGLTLIPPVIQGRLVDGVLTPHRNIGLLWQLMVGWLVVIALNSLIQIVNGQ